jgi:RNA polymerase sigma-70 factor (ECF subfamily)
MNYKSLSCNDLVRACVDSRNFEAWEEFVCRFGKLISIVVSRVARQYGEYGNSIVTDLVQDTFTKLCEDDCRVLREFTPRHPDAFFGMLKVVAAHVAHDHFRGRNSSKRGSRNADTVFDESEAVAISTQSGPMQMDRQILLQEIDKALRDVCSDERDREIFWFHYRHGFTAKTIAQIGNYGLGTKGIESILHRLRSQLRARLVEQSPSRGIWSRSEGIQGEKTLSKGEGRS